MAREPALPSLDVVLLHIDGELKKLFVFLPLEPQPTTSDLINMKYI